jgi:hypothetical protein
MTIIGVCVAPSEQSPRLEQLGVEERCSGRAANRVVDESDHPDVQNRAATDPAHGHGHASLAIAIETGLRPVSFVENMKRAARGRRKGARLGLAGELLDRLPDRFDDIAVRLLPQGKGDGHDVPVDRGHAVRLRRDAERRVDEPAVGPASENAEWLALDLRFFAGNVGNDVVEDGVRGDAGVASPIVEQFGFVTM